MYGLFSPEVTQSHTHINQLKEIITKGTSLLKQERELGMLNIYSSNKSINYYLRGTSNPDQAATDALQTWLRQQIYEATFIMIQQIHTTCLESPDCRREKVLIDHRTSRKPRFSSQDIAKAEQQQC